MLARSPEFLHNWLKLVWQVDFMLETQLLVSKTAGTTGVEGGTTEGTVMLVEGMVVLVEGTVVLVVGVTVVLVVGVTVLLIVGVTVLVLAAGVTVVSNILEAFPRLA